MWSRKFAECRQCATRTSPHYGGGLCKQCYQKHWAAKNKQDIQKRQRNWYQASKSKVDYRKKSIINRYGLQAWKKLQTESCAKCGTREKLQIHHQDHAGLNVPKRLRNNNNRNLRILCITCHAREHIAIECVGWSLRYACCRLCNSTDRRHQALGYCTRCYSAKDQKPRPWAKNCGHTACQKCGTIQVPHKGKGLCRRCFEATRVRGKV